MSEIDEIEERAGHHVVNVALSLTDFNRLLALARKGEQPNPAPGEQTYLVRVPDPDGESRHECGHRHGWAVPEVPDDLPYGGGGCRSRQVN